MSEQPKATVLSIDDEQDILTAVSACLGDGGYRVFTANGGHDGLQLFEECGADLVLVDLRMPEVSGFDVITHVRTHSPDTPVVVLSGTGVLQDAVTALRMGAWDYLTKPIENKNLLFHAIESSLEKAKLRLENKEYHQNLERMLEERTADLRAARDAAQAANRAKDEFLANMSHELRTPLNAIIGFADLSLMSDLDAEIRGYLEVIRNSGRDLHAILSGILDLTKIEAGVLELQREVLTPRRLAEEVVGAVETTVQGKPLTLRWEVDPRVPESLVGDPFHLKRVLLNLLGNAVRFTPKGEVRLKVAREDAVSASNDGSFLLRFSVIDTGIGIPKELQDKIFEPFTQADSSATRTYGGVGLGLTLCRRMIEKLGGRIWVESEPGKGSAFRFTCPFALAPL